MSRIIYESSDGNRVQLSKFAGYGHANGIQVTSTFNGKTEFVRMTEDEFKQVIKAYLEEQLFGIKL